MGRTPCCSAEDLKKGAWTVVEDQKLIAYIQEHGEGGWRTLPQKAGLQRCGKSCRLRWVNYLRPDIKRGEFTLEEEQKIIQLHTTLGNRWSAIARHLPRRTDNEVKNYWNTHLKKRLTGMGNYASHKPNSSTTDGPSISTSNDSTSSDPTTQHCESFRPSIQLLNKLAAKLASSRCLEALKDSQSRSQVSISTKTSDSNGEKEATDVSISNNDTFDTNSPSLVLGSPKIINPLTMSMPIRPVSSSARLLNKMATRLSTPLSCIDALKSLLSKSATGNNGTTSCSTIDHTQCFASTSSFSESPASENGSYARSVSTSASKETINEMTTSLPPPALDEDDPFDLDLLKDWEGFSTDQSMEDCGINVIGGRDVSGKSISNTYDIDSPMSPLNFINNTVPTINSACESSELSDSLGTSMQSSRGELNEALTTYDHKIGFSSRHALDDVFGAYQY